MRGGPVRAARTATTFGVMGSVMSDSAAEIVRAAGWDDLGDVRIEGADPVLPSDWPCAELAAVALARVGTDAARVSRLGGGSAGTVSASVQDGAA